MIFQQMTSTQSSRPCQNSTGSLEKKKVEFVPLFSLEVMLALFMEDFFPTIACTLSIHPTVCTGSQGYDLFFFFFFFVSLFECMLIISHYIMQVPPALYDEQGRSINKGHVYISESSPPQVSQAYYKQFKEDFMLFLGSRSEELIVGGRMVLILLGRRGPDHVDRGNSFFWELLSRSFANLISKVINGILCTII